MQYIVSFHIPTIPLLLHFFFQKKMGDPVDLDKEGEVSNKDIINDIHNHEEKNATGRLFI